MGRYTTVSIPTTLYRRLQEMIKDTGFTSVSEYVTYILREVVALKQDTKNPHLTPEELEALRRKLEALGYL
ncbi:ribbon-helix-helix domain-containing protein [Pyrobaculum islandicum]|uniref:ribbon-helix-helix domain-containing protein n=1 Tax=Pyrobaculum islandicum TaxID=2277 RepID=UPI00069DB898|nr:ribbon-helix-helix domain-containing protein [Pyrobaculum islandicum]